MGSEMCIRDRSNVVVDRRVNGTILPKKEHRDSPKKIDGIDALIMAIGGAVANDRRVSIYDRPELWGDSDQKPADQAQPWDPAVLANPKHKDWQKHREAFEQSLAMADDDY